jgi:formylglycine-generating enzyme required for sulfatase activity
VSWHDAQAYVRWLSDKTGHTYRLLSDVEWEYVARAGTATPFWWGRTISTTQANYDGNLVYGNGAKGEYRKRTVPVDSFEGNGWGLYNIHGNVWEWVADCVRDGTPPDPGCSRTFRGGAWGSPPKFLRAAWRSYYEADRAYYTGGFRVKRLLY